MARLIDVDEAMNAFLDDCMDEYGKYFSYHDIDRVLDTVPKVEAVPVVRGEWISLTDCANAGVYCSVCHKKVWKEDYAWCNRKNKLRSNYCPNCGAKMDGGAEDGKTD